MIEVTKKFCFESAHKLYIKGESAEMNEEIFGPCSRLHGHSYKLFVTAEGEQGDDGMVINFTDLSKIVNDKVIKELDHQYLNDILGDDHPLTCENMLPMIVDVIKPELEEKGIRLKKLVMYETEKCFATLNL